MISALTVEDLERLIESSVSSARESEALLPSNRLAYTEPQAASAMGVKSHVLRDARLRGDIKATKIGGCHGYMRDDLITYLQGNKA